MHLLGIFETITLYFSFQIHQRFVLATWLTKTHVLQYTQTPFPSTNGTPHSSQNAYYWYSTATASTQLFSHRETEFFGAELALTPLAILKYHINNKEMPQVVAKRKKSIFLDPNPVPVALYIPNLVGYLRFIFLFVLFYFSKSVVWN